MEIVDIHSHVLPGVDDGAVSVDETIAMLRIAYDSGTRKIVATPHMFLDLFHNNDFVQILDRFEQLKSDLESCQESFPFLQEMHIYSGAENFASQEFLAALEQGCVIQVNADSIKGGSGSRARKCSRSLLQSGGVDVIASDGHRLRWRPQNLGGVLGRLEEEYTKDDIAGWLVENPGRILANKRLVSAVAS